MSGRFPKLAGRMRELQITQEELGAMIGKRMRTAPISRERISARMCAKTPWTLEEMWIVMDLLGIAADEMHLFFPYRVVAA